MRVLGLDIEEKLIGIAVSDALGIVAQRCGFIENRSKIYVVEKIKEIIAEKDIVQVVIGVPLNLNGSIGRRGGIALEFKKVLEEAISLPVDTWDERFSDKSIGRVLAQKGDARRRKRKEKIEKVAAQWMLQGYLDKNRNEIEEYYYEEG